MPVATVLLTDTFGQWVTKTNALITAVNTLGASASALSISSPTTGQLLIYDGTFFTNVTMSGDATINSAGVVTVAPDSVIGVSKGRLYFAGCCAKSLY